MLIPSIDLKGGRVVQLVQGERLALESDDLDGWVARFSGFPKVSWYCKRVSRYSKKKASCVSKKASYCTRNGVCTI